MGRILSDMNDEVREELHETLREFFRDRYETDQGGQFMLDVMWSLWLMFSG